MLWRNGNIPKEVLKTKHLTLIFSLGTSIASWDECGHMSREVNIHKKLASYLRGVDFVTYGSYDHKYNNTLAPLRIVSKPPWITAIIYSLLMPLIHWNIFISTDILKSNQMPGSWAAVLAKMIFKKPLIIRCGYEWEMFRKMEGVRGLKLWLIHALETIAYRVADAIVLTSLEAKQYVCKTFRVNPKKVHVIRNYIDTSIFRPLPATRIARRLICVGRLIEQKNLFGLLRAIEGMKDVELVLVGDGPLRGVLETYAKEHGVHVIFKGSVPNHDIPKIMSEATVFVIPSYHEGNPKALLEAMACGLMVVGTKVPGIKELIVNGQTGFLADGIRPEYIRESISRALNMSDQTLITNAARQYIESTFSIDAIMGSELYVINILLGKRLRST